MQGLENIKMVKLLGFEKKFVQVYNFHSDIIAILITENLYL